MARAPARRNVDPAVASASAKHAVYCRDQRPPEEIQRARAELADAMAEAEARRWPPLSPEARNRIACLILSGGTAGSLNP